MYEILTPENLPEKIQLLEKSSGIEKIDLLNSLASYYLQSDPKLAEEYSQNSYELCRTLNDSQRLADSIFLLGRACYNSLDFPSSIEHLTNASILFESLDDHLNQAKALLMIGVLQDTLGDHSRAVDALFKALKLSRDSGNTRQESEALMQIGNSYWQTKENNLALEYLHQSYELRLRSSDKKELGSITGNIGNVYINLRSFEKAFEYYSQCRTIFEELNSPVDIGKADINIAITLCEMKKFDEALQTAFKGLEIFTALDKKENIAEALSITGSIYSEMGEYDTALKYYDDAIELSEKYNFKRTLEVMFGAKSHAASMKGDYKSAYENFVKYHEVLNKRLQNAAEMKTKYLNVVHKVDTLKKESEVLAGKNAELNELNERLKLLNDEKNEFLEIAAHDLKNPLTSISLSATTIKKYLDTFSREKIETHLDKIAETSDRMKNIVTNLISTNAIEAGKYIVDKQELNLSELLKYIVEDFQQRASHKHIEIVLTLDENKKITTDEKAVYSILDNLISNAVKYSSEGSYIFVKLIAEGKDKVTIKIKDNGLGIPENEKEKVFQKFSRISNKPTGGENSTGLGLSIVKKLTDLIGGKITFESEYGKGTTFTLELPVE